MTDVNCEFKVGDTVEEVTAGKVTDVGTVTKIDHSDYGDLRVWCRWENCDDLYFPACDTYSGSHFYYRKKAGAATQIITLETVRTVLNTYHDHVRSSREHRSVHEAILQKIKKDAVLDSEEFKVFKLQYEKFKEYL